MHQASVRVAQMESDLRFGGSSVIGFSEAKNRPQEFQALRLFVLGGGSVNTKRRGGGTLSTSRPTRERKIYR